MLEEKTSNPKDRIGSPKISLSNVPCGPLMEAALAMTEGSHKYGRHNYREAPVKASVYYDALQRHIMSWWEGEDFASDSGLHHTAHAMACLIILMDAGMHDKLIDDRPPRTDPSWIHVMNSISGELDKKYPNKKAPYTEKPLD